MEKGKRLIKNTLIIFISVFATKLINFIMLPLYTKWFTVEEYGVVDVFLAIVSLCVPICTLQIEQAVFRFIIDKNCTSENSRSYLKTSAVFVGISFVIITCAGGVASIITNYIYVLLYAVAVATQCIFVYLQYIARGVDKTMEYTISSIILAIVNVLLTILFVRYLYWGVSGYVMAFIVSHISAGIYLIYHTRIYSVIKEGCFKVTYVKELLAYSIPMIVNNISWWILNLSDKFVLKVFCGNEANGFFAAAGKIPGLVTTVYSVFHMSWQESISREIDSEDVDEYVKKVFERVFVIISFSALCLLLLGKEMFHFLVDEKFASSYTLMPILIVGLWFLCIAQYLGGLYIGLKLPTELGKTSAIAATINLCVDLICVHYIGIYAACVSTLVAYGFLFVYRMIDIQKYYSIKFDYKMWIVIIFMGISVAFAYCNISNFKYIFGVITVIVFVFFYKNMLGEVYSMIKSKLKL